VAGGSRGALGADPLSAVAVAVRRAFFGSSSHRGGWADADRDRRWSGWWGIGGGAGRRILAYCQVGQRGYLATRILLQAGFAAANLGGGYTTYRLHRPA